MQFTRNRDGSYTNKTAPSYRGAVVTYNEDGTSRLKMRDGTSCTFNGYGVPDRAILVGQSDRNGNGLTFVREEEYNITKIIGADGRTMATLSIPIEYRDRYRQIVDIAGRKVSYLYGGYGLESVTDPAGGVTRYEHDTSGRITAIIDLEGNTTVKNTYDANGRVYRQEHANGGDLEVPLYYGQRCRSSRYGSPDEIWVFERLLRGRLEELHRGRDSHDRSQRQPEVSTGLTAAGFSPA
ncbi:MAG: RHS repeat domain-containing protein [Syntrophobacter sp.]